MNRFKGSSVVSMEADYRENLMLFPEEINLQKDLEWESGRKEEAVSHIDSWGHYWPKWVDINDHAAEHSKQLWQSLKGGHKGLKLMSSL